MGINTPLKVLYYGLLASITGGFVFPFHDTKKNRIYIFVFHLYSFLMFFVPPIGLLFGLQDNLLGWKIGWSVYGVAVLGYFVFVKVVNFRLHRALGRDFVDREDEEGKKPEDAKPSKDQVESMRMADLSEAVESDDKEEGLKEGVSDNHEEATVEVVVVPSRREDSGDLPKPPANDLPQPPASDLPQPPASDLPQPPAFMKETSEDMAKLGGASLSQSSSPSDEGGATIELSSVDRNHSKQDLEAQGPAGPTVTGVEESSEDDVKSTPQLVSALDDLEQLKARLQTYTSIMNPRSEGEERMTLRDDPVSIRQRSNSLPFHTEAPSPWDRRRAGNRSFRQPGRQRHRRHEGRSRDFPQPYSESNVASLPPLPPALRTSTEDREGSGIPAPPPPPPIAASLSLESQPSLQTQVSSSDARAVTVAFRNRGYSIPTSVVPKLSPEVIQAITWGTLPDATYDYISSRVADLRRGRLAKSHEETGNHLIHWFQISEDEWEFYIMDGEGDDTSLPADSFEDSDDSETDLTQTHGRNVADILGLRDLGLRDSINSPSSVQTPRIESAQPTNSAPAATDTQPPKYLIIPRVEATGVEITLNRNQLEEFMDRNHTVWEVILTTLLATAVVPVTGALLLMDFFQVNPAAGFFLCYMATTAMFSLIKSVYPEPASPTPGANRYSASSRAFYYILLGCIALILNAVLPPQGSPGDPLCVYGLTLSMTYTITVARDALLYVILFFPVLYMMGVLPQVNTFVIWLLEQIEMFIFGGTASTSVFSSIFALVRSLLFVALLWPLGFGGYFVYSCPPNGTCLINQGCTRLCPYPASPCQFNVVFSVYLGMLFAMGYHLSRSTSNYRLYLDLVLHGAGEVFLKCCPGSYCGRKQGKKDAQKDHFEDPLEGAYRKSLRLRLLQDLVYCVVIFLVVTALSLSTVFCVTFASDARTRPQPLLHFVLCSLAAVVGIVNHYFVPHLRKETPWLFIAQPLVKAKEYGVFEPTDDAAMTYFEHAYTASLFIEKNILYPLIFLSGLHTAAPNTLCVFGPYGAALVTTVAGLRIIRYAYGELSRQHMILIITVLFFNFDYAHLSEGFPLDYFIISVLFYKFYDLLLKMRFIFAYIAPWNVNWSSVKHVVIQPLLIPHTPLIFFMTLAGSVFNAAINPVSASTLFLLSYMRPLKFWEKDYNTKRSDNSNTRLDSQLDKMQKSQDQDQYDSLYYEHLTWVLQKELCGDLHLGRWGRVTAGDFFILNSDHDKLNALVHIIEYGNGFVTFQLRGLEFGGTYCHQREVEAITEPIAESEGCLCCNCCKIQGILAFNPAVAQRWYAWEMVSTSYVLKGYSIAENQLYTMFNAHEFKKSYLTFMVHAIIYKLTTSESLSAWLENTELRDSLEPLSQANYIDNWGPFNESRIYLVDHDIARDGISREAFVLEFMPLILNCTRAALDKEVSGDDFFVTLAFALSLAGRRSFLSQMQQGGGSRSSSDFMHGVYQMFVGDARPHDNDAWLLLIVESVDSILIPAVRMAIKLHDESFTGYSGVNEAFETMKNIDQNHLITFEADRRWRNAVVTNHPSLLAIRYQNQPFDYFNYGHTSNPYKIIRLSTKNVLYKVIKINRECVRALWTSQQHEILFIRSDDSERGSIQNAKSVLRNMVNSSMDLPLGYPIYVSPLTTSYIENHSKLQGTLHEKATSPQWLAKSTYQLLLKCKVCSQKLSTSQTQASKAASNQPPTPSNPRVSIDPLTGLPRDQGIVPEPYVDPFPDDSDEEDIFQLKWINKDVVICDLAHVHESFNQAWLKWPNPGWKSRVWKNTWKDWSPEEGMSGKVLHEWRPFHIKHENRSPLDKVMLLVEVDEQHFVLVNEQGVGDTTKL